MSNRLSLDYTGVLSAWERTGAGNIFSCEDIKFEDPTTVTLDLSGWEASLKPSGGGPAVKQEETNIFSSGLFSAAEMGLSYLPGQPSSSSQQDGVSNQVVPSYGGSESEPGSSSDIESDAAAAVTSMRPQPPQPPAAASPSTSSSEAGVVPELAPNSNSSTATSTCSFSAVPEQQQQAALADAPAALSRAASGTVPVAPQAPVPAAAQPAMPAAVPVPQPAAGGPSQPGPPSKPDDGFVRTRAECLQRYREKRARRLYTKKIRYQLRKINADKRPRIKGRFVKKEELAEYLKTSQGGRPEEEGEDEDGLMLIDSDDE